MQWTIEAAKESAGRGEPVVVTSDDDKILDIAEACGARPHKRPGHLASDQATMRDVVREYFAAHGDALEIVLLYPTSPFRGCQTILQAVAMYDGRMMSDSARGDTLMSVHESRARPFGGLHIANGKLVYDEASEAYYRRQDTPGLYHANGAIFIIGRTEIESLNTQLFNKETLPFVMYGHENIEIDTPQELEIARALVDAGAVKHGEWRTAAPRTTMEAVST